MRITSSSPCDWTQPAAIPDCGQASRPVHSRYHPTQPADLPCRHRRPGSASRCGGSTASTQPATPDLRRDAHDPPRTARPAHARLGEAQASVGLACGGAGGARLLTHLHMPQAARPCCGSSPACRCPTRRPPPVGNDYWAIRKGSRYGTIVVDLDSSPASSTSSRIARQPTEALTGSNGIPASNSSPGSLDGVCPRCKPRRSPGAAGRRSLAPATNMRQAVRTLAPQCPCPLRNLPPSPSSAVRARQARPCLRPQHAELEAGTQSRMRWQLSTTSVRTGMPAGSPCSGSPVPWAGSCDGCANMRAPKRSRRGCLTWAGPSLLESVRRVLAERIDEAARTRWPCGARSGTGATRNEPAGAPLRRRAPDEAGPIRPQAPPCDGSASQRPWHGSSIAARTAAGVVARPATLRAGRGRRSCGEMRRAV